jgi:hypothetical protein
MLVSGSANPSEPPAPGEPNDRAPPNGQVAQGFMNPSEN